MSAIANIVVQDGAVTPANHTFTPRSTNPAAYRNGASVGSANGISYDETIVVDVSVNPKGMSKVKLTLITPHVSVVANGIPDYFETAKVEFLIPQYSSMQNRKDLRTMIRNLLADAQLVDAIDNLAYPY